MTFLLDTNVLSEPTKPQVSGQVLAWLRKHETESVVDAIVMAEVWRGVDGMADGRKKNELILWLEEVRATTPSLDWTIDTGIVWAELINKVKRAGFTVGLKDTMIAATAKRHGLTVATRNVEDFTRCGVSVVNPFA